MKNCMFIVLMLFGFNTVADMHSGMSMDQMSDMVGSSEATMGGDSDSGFTGSFSVRYQPIGKLGVSDDVTYRARVGWMGHANDQVKWGVVLSTNTEQNFSSLRVRNISFEQAYVSYSPVENLHVKIGKTGWMPDFHKVGVLVSEQVYQEGVKVKYKHEISEDNNVYAKVGAYKLTGTPGTQNAPLQDGTTVEGKIGTSFGFSGVQSKVYLMGIYDGFLKGSDDENAEKVDAKTLAKVGAMVHSAEMAVPFGVFGHYFSDFSDLGKGSWTAGISFGNAGHAHATEVGDWGLAASYYDIDANNYRTAWLNEDYVNGAGTGAAVRAQYNVWENSSLAVKYAWDKDAGDDDAHNVVAELSFVF